VETFVKLVQKKGRGPPQQDHHHGCHVKAKAIASCTKQIVLDFFDDQGLVYMNYVPRVCPLTLNTP
jgi:hypothetical protein